MISSTGEAAEHVGEALGQFEYHENKGYYIQSSTEQRNKDFVAVYLYPDEDDWWFVGTTPFLSAGLLLNPRPSKIPPTSGWKWGDGESFHDDPTLTVTSGPLPPLSRQFTVTATGVVPENLQEYLGVFTRTQRWSLGRPVYVNTAGNLLHHGPGFHGWVIGPTFGMGFLSGSQARQSPASEDNWRYYSKGEFRPAHITVTRGSKITKNLAAANRPDLFIMKVLIAWFVVRIN